MCLREAAMTAKTRREPMKLTRDNQKRCWLKVTDYRNMSTSYIILHLQLLYDAITKCNCVVDAVMATLRMVQPSLRFMAAAPGHAVQGLHRSWRTQSGVEELCHYRCHSVCMAAAAVPHFSSVISRTACCVALTLPWVSAVSSSLYTGPHQP